MPLDDLKWSTSLPDWRKRLFNGSSLIPPDMPLFPVNRNRYGARWRAKREPITWAPDEKLLMIASPALLDSENHSPLALDPMTKVSRRSRD